MSDPPSAGVSGAMVEAGAREIDPYAFTGYRYGPEAAAQSREAARHKARSVLTAALRLNDPERARWATYRFECPRDGCGSAVTLADHARRDPDTFPRRYCNRHGGIGDGLMEFVCSTPLYEVPPPASDPETVERVSRAIEESDARTAWGTQTAAETYGRRARAAIDALLNTTDDKGEQ